MGIFGAVFGAFVGITKLVGFYQDVGKTTQNRIDYAQAGLKTYFDAHGIERWIETNEPVMRIQMPGQDEVIKNSQTGRVICNLSEQRRATLDKYDLAAKKRAIETGEQFYCTSSLDKHKDINYQLFGGLECVRDVQDDKAYIWGRVCTNVSQTDDEKYTILWGKTCLRYNLLLDIKDGSIKKIYPAGNCSKKEPQYKSEDEKELYRKYINIVLQKCEEKNKENNELYGRNYDWTFSGYYGYRVVDVEEV